MAADNWNQIRDIFEKATRLGFDDRPAFLVHACNGDEDLLDEVRSLLDAHDTAASFLETPAGDLLLSDTPRPSKCLENGARLGHYEIVDLLGSGGMGEVYLATDQKLGRNVAVKILNARLNSDETQLRRFIREAKTASALNHPNILVIHEFGETGDAHFIVSELVDGKTLRAIIREGGLQLSKVVQIATQIANALSAAHQADLIHRDIKPENIMVRRDGYVKVLDFGLAKLAEPAGPVVHKQGAGDACTQLNNSDSETLANQTAAGMVLGTLNYMSPEQARGEHVDARTDIFSFGVVVHEMITGQTPAADQSFSSESRGVPDELIRLVRRCIEPDRERRYQSMDYVLADLSSIAASPAFKRGTYNEDAYWVYLQGKNLIATHSPVDARTAIDYFDKAIELDAGFARAHAGRAQGLFIASHGGGGSQMEMNESAKLAASRALELDPALGEAHAVFGEIAFTHDWNLQEAEHYLRRSVELEPASELGHAIYGEYLATRARFNEAVTEIKTALEIEPKSCANQVIYGRILYFARRYEDAIVQFKRVIEVFPSWTTAYGWIWLSYEMMRDFENAYKWLILNQEQNNVPADRINAYRAAFEESGWPGVGLKLLEFENPQTLAGNYYALARHALRVGDRRLALEHLDRSYDAHQYQVTWLSVDPFFDPVRNEPAFNQLLKRAGLS